ncbi:MAG: endonuclease MutS2 [Clostridiales bacterium]|nr:endonuclease MutS2 [Clostridiales bacterium]
MIDFDKYAQTLEFDKVLSLLADCALTQGAKQRALALRPETEKALILANLQQTTDAKAMAAIKGTPSFGGVRDITNATDRAEKGAMLTHKELLEVANLLYVVRGLLTYIRTDQRESTSLDELFSLLQPCRTLEDAIKKAVISEDMLADEASPALSEIRRKMRRTNSRIKDTLQQTVTSGKYAKFLQDNIVTMRGGRYVVPVKAEYRNEIKGLLHETSSSGATLFIEPMAVVEANNELRELESAEKDEIERILYALSARTAQAAALLNENYALVTELAFIFAKATLSYKLDASSVHLVEERIIELKRARHPLLEKGRAVPITAVLGGEYDTLVITGPNTGGKTVALKTMGLLVMMVQSGLHIPCEDTSRLCVFDNVLADIGDEQSIEQSLSTFSAHMVRIVDILDAVSERSLVLFDELGSGTDPTEGAALAIAIIENVREKRALCAATTHYAELKVYALDTAGVCNASCEFDVNTLQPTYRLVIGTPGKSNAFAISSRLGLAPAIIERAKGYVRADEKRFEQVIEKLERSRMAMEENEARAKEEKRAIEAYKAQEEKRIQQMAQAAEKEINRARAESVSVVKSAKAVSDRIFEELEALKKKKDAEDFAKALEESRRKIRRQLRSANTDIREIEFDEDESSAPSRPIKQGDEVYLKNVGRRGTVVSGPDAKGNVTVAAGRLTTKTTIQNLVLAEDNGMLFTSKEGKSMPAKQYRPSAPRAFSPEIDLRGLTGDDAWWQCDKYLDDALLSGVHQVTLVHGKGTGALRAFIQAQLKKDTRVASFRGGKIGEGDAGVTVVELK